MRGLGVLLTCAVAAVLAVGTALGAAAQAEGASGLKVCGSGYGHGVGLSQYGAKGRAESGQGHEQIIKAYYSGAKIRERSSAPVRVLLAESASNGSHEITVRQGRSATMRNLASGGTVDLGPGRYRITHLPDRGLYRVTNVSEGEKVGVYSGPLNFNSAGSGPLGFGASDYRSTLQVRNANSRLLLINRLGMEAYLRGVVPQEMPSSWEAEALESQAIAARSYAEATRRSGAFDFYDDVRDQVYGGEPITAFFHSSSGGYTESSANVFGGAVPYLKAIRDVDRAGRAYEGRAYANSPWMNWRGEIASNGSPQFGVGSIRKIETLDRSPSGRVTKVRVKGTEGEKIVSGQQNIRFGLKSTGIKRADGSTRPGGALPSARVSFGSGCN